MSQVRVEEALRNRGVGQEAKVKETGIGAREGSMSVEWKGQRARR